MADVGVTVIAATSDESEAVSEMARDLGLTMPVAAAVTRSDTEPMDIWWADHREHGWHVEPCELLLGRGGVVLGAMHASGPVGRMSVQEVLTMIRRREER